MHSVLVGVSIAEDFWNHYPGELHSTGSLCHLARPPCSQAAAASRHDREGPTLLGQPPPPPPATTATPCGLPPPSITTIHCVDFYHGHRQTLPPLRDSHHRLLLPCELYRCSPPPGRASLCHVGYKVGWTHTNYMVPHFLLQDCRSSRTHTSI